MLLPVQRTLLLCMPWIVHHDRIYHTYHFRGVMISLSESTTTDCGTVWTPRSPCIVLQSILRLPTMTGELHNGSLLQLVLHRPVKTSCVWSRQLSSPPEPAQECTDLRHAVLRCSPFREFRHCTRAAAARPPTQRTGCCASASPSPRTPLARTWPRSSGSHLPTGQHSEHREPFCSSEHRDFDV